MHLQAILHCTDFCKTLSLRHLSTSRHHWAKDLITVVFSFILCHFFLVRTVEDIYPFRSICLMCVQSLYEPSYFRKSIHCLQGGPSAPGGHTEVCGCHSPLLWDIPGGVTPRLMASAGQGRGTLLWEVSQCFSGHQLCAAACCLPWGPSATSFCEISRRLTLNTGLFLLSRTLSFGTQYLYICPDPHSLTKLNLDMEWFRRVLSAPQIVSFAWSMCSFPSLIFFLLLIYIMLLAS